MIPPAEAIRLVVLDMAGTTVHDQDFVTEAFQGALEESGLHVAGDEIKRVMGYPKPEAVRRLLRGRDGAQPAADRVRDIHARFVTRINALYAGDARVREVDGATGTFRCLRRRGVRVALNTGFGRATADIILERLGWLAEVDLSIASDEAPRGRPHADMILALMERAGIEPARAVAKVGDTPSDLLEGSAAGCGWVIGVSTGAYGSDELRAHPHTHLLASVAGLPALFEAP